MIRQRQGLLNCINATADAGLIWLSYLLAAWLRLDYMTQGQPFWGRLLDAEFSFMAALYAVLMVSLYALLRLYGSFRFHSFWQESFTLALANAVGILAIGSVLYLFRLVDFSRLVLVFFYLFSTLLVISKRFLVRLVLGHYRKLGYNQRTLLLVGSGSLAYRYYQEILNHPQYGYLFAGYLDAQKSPLLSPYLGTPQQLRDVLQSTRIDEVVIAAQDTSFPISDMIAACGRYGAKASVIPSYNDFIPATPTVEVAGGLKLLNVRSTPDKGPVWAFVKRAMDLCGAVCGLVLASPIMLAAAIAVKRCDGGPAIFAQTRVGKNGREFKMYKFRSMYTDAEARLAELQKYNQVDGPAFKMENDPRITPVGRFLRKTSIDELPQLVNILKGDMSLVGPRPPLPREVARYSDWDWGRLAVKPGLTCYWQVSGRSNVSFGDWMKLDLKYVEEQGLWTDLKILAKTVLVVLRGEGAY